MNAVLGRGAVSGGGRMRASFPEPQASVCSHALYWPDAATDANVADNVVSIAPRLQFVDRDRVRGRGVRGDQRRYRLEPPSVGCR
jgi:hypothetical protein